MPQILSGLSLLVLILPMPGCVAVSHCELNLHLSGADFKRRAKSGGTPTSAVSLVSLMMLTLGFGSPVEEGGGRI